jgi:hypothetical protein
MATYVNDLRLKEIATGDESGTWGTSTNTNLELIADAFSYATKDCFASDADATETMADGVADEIRSLYLKVTSSATLTATRTLTLAPNTVSKTWIIENATTGGQSINISQGSGANVTIPNGDTKIIYTDGAGAGAAVTDAFASLKVTDPAQTNITSVGTLTALTGGTGDLNWDSGTLFVDSSANAVGIGTTSPDGKVHIESSSSGATAGAGGDELILESSATTGLSILSGTANDGNILFGDSGNSAIGYVQYKHADNALNFGVNGGTKATIDSSGNVGIGVTSIGTQGQLYIGASGTSTDAKIALSPTNSSGGQNPLAQIGSTANGTYGSELYFTTRSTGATLAEAMRITSSGNVGIGTTSPASK